MAKSGRNQTVTDDPNKMSTRALSFVLRIYAEHEYNRSRTKAAVMIAAANRLDDQAERIAIMSEPAQVTEEELAFPPADDELKGDTE